LYRNGYWGDSRYMHLVSVRPYGAGWTKVGAGSWLDRLKKGRGRLFDASPDRDQRGMPAGPLGVVLDRFDELEAAQ
jgi:hypothetical protein